MDERQIAKDALKMGYMKEIVSQLIEKFKLSEDAIAISEKGEILFFGIMRQYPDNLYDFVRFLLAELANTKAELWLQTQSNKETE